MSPFDLNQVSAIPIDDGQESDHAVDCSLSSVATPPNFFDPRVVDYNRLVHHLQHPVLVQQDQFHRLISAGSQGSDGGKVLDLSLCGTGIGRDGEEEEEAPPPEIFRSEKWLPSKMRFMRKMMSSARSTAEGSGQMISSSNSAGGGGGGDIVRVCSDCNTTKTPLWRSGPRGPKSLCNACGIRQRKARRAMAAAAAAMNGGVVIPPPPTAYKVRKEKKLDIDIDRTLPFKKRCKANTATATATATAITSTTAAAASKKLRLEEALTLSSRTKNSALMQKVFPQEERDAAILLMTLSCGLIRS